MNANNNDNLNTAAERGKVELLYAAIQDDPSILENIDKIQFVETPLHISASRGHLVFATEIMNLKSSFAMKLNQQGFSPIHLAMQEGQTAMVSKLVGINKDLVRVKGREGLTALHLVCQNGEVELLAEFLTACPDSIEDVTVRGESALHIAVIHEQIKALELLVCFLKKNTKRGARKLEYKILNLKDVSGNTILHILVQRIFTQEVRQIVKQLLKRGINLNAKNMVNETALDVVLVDPPQIRSILIRAGAELGVNVEVPTLAEKLSSHTKIIDSVLIWIRGIRRDITEEQRNTWLIIATLVATATYQSVLSPPGGFYQANATDTNSNTTSSYSTISTTGKAGKSVLSRSDFFAFSHLNVFSFGVSIMAILIMTPWGEVGTTLVFGPVVWFAVSYLYSMNLIAPSNNYSAVTRFLFSLIGIAMVILSLIIMYFISGSAMLRN
ncbi:unnamed protein product [Lathyrus oleraceus]